MKLIAPEAYLHATRFERAKFCNGCGGGGSWTYWLVPNTIWGLCVKDACNVHDWMYSHHLGKFRSDLVFLCNLLILCSSGSKLLYPLRATRCLTYYLAVTVFGRRWYAQKVADKGRHGRG